MNITFCDVNRTLETRLMMMSVWRNLILKIYT